MDPMCGLDNRVWIMKFAKVRIVEVPMAVRAEIEAHDLIEKTLQQSGLYDGFCNGDRGIFEHLLIAWDLDGSPERGRPNS